MRNEIDPFVLDARPEAPAAAPSLRVPVTAANRDLLRRLRAAEMSAWEAGRRWSGQLPEPGATLSANRRV